MSQEPRWPVGEYLVPSKILAGKKNQRKGGKENRKLPKLAQRASLVLPHSPRGKEQGGRCFSTPARSLGWGGWDGWTSGSLPVSETQGLG